MSNDLFDLPPNPAANLLPYDGIFNDYGCIFAPAEADAHLHDLQCHIPWQADEVRLFGKHIRTARAVAWYGDAAFAYTYSGTTRHARAWTPHLWQLKLQVERHLRRISPTVFNACLLNRYHHGGEGMAWHSDNEAALGPDTVIASLSFGATRLFALRHPRRGHTFRLPLQHGQLVVMRGNMQQHWQHAILKSRTVDTERISLTFRTYRGG